MGEMDVRLGLLLAEGNVEKVEAVWHEVIRELKKGWWQAPCFSASFQF